MMDRFVLSHLRGVANKVAYCIGCKACMVQCPFAAFEITAEGRILIREERCKHCSNCITFTNGKGCLVAKSLSTTMGGNTMNLKGMNRYQTFGFRTPWLQGFFDYGTDYLLPAQTETASLMPCASGCVKRDSCIPIIAGKTPANVPPCVKNYRCGTHTIRLCGPSSG